MYDSSFPFDRFFIYIFGMLCMWAWYWFLVSFVLQSRTILHIFLLWETGRGLWIFFLYLYSNLHFLHFRVIFDYFLVIYGRGWWSNRRFGFVLFCVLCAHESSVLGLFFFLLFFFSKRFSVRLKYYFWKHSPIWYFSRYNGISALVCMYHTS